MQLISLQGDMFLAEISHSKKKIHFAFIRYPITCEAHIVSFLLYICACTVHICSEVANMYVLLKEMC